MQLQLAKRRYVDPAEIAGNYAELGDKDQAFAWLEKAYSEKSNVLGYLKTRLSGVVCTPTRGMPQC
jgi:hypothetical protein